MQLREISKEIQENHDLNKLYILYYKLKYIEEQFVGRRVDPKIVYASTSVYDYVVYKLYISIQEIVEQKILTCINSFELSYTFVDKIIKEITQSANNVQGRSANEGQGQSANEGQGQSANEGQGQLENEVISINNTSLNNIIDIIERKIVGYRNRTKHTSTTSNEINKLSNMYSLILLLKNEYQNEYKDKKKVLKKILSLLKENIPTLTNNDINSIEKINILFDSILNEKRTIKTIYLQREILKLKKVFHYSINMLHVTNDDIQTIQLNNDLPPPYSNINNYYVLPSMQQNAFPKN